MGSTAVATVGRLHEPHVAAQRPPDVAYAGIPCIHAAYVMYVWCVAEPTCQTLKCVFSQTQSLRDDDEMLSGGIFKWVL